MVRSRWRARAKDTAKGPQHALGLERYQAINPYPRNTLELRVFASSLDVQLTIISHSASNAALIRRLP
jgi:hypothetical protein